MYNEIPFDDCNECPECGSYYTEATKVSENTDLDGNRGMMVTYLRCLDCDHEVAL